MKREFFLHPNHRGREGVVAALAQYVADPAKGWLVTVAPIVKTRTKRQNRALFGVAYPIIAAAMGEDVDELHTAFCKRFFGRVEVMVLGEVSVRPFRTTTRDENGQPDILPRAEFAQFYEMVQRVGAEAGVYIPDPDPMLAR